MVMGENSEKMTFVKVFVTGREKEELKERAKEVHCSMSGYCRQMVMFNKTALNSDETVKAILAASGNIGKLTGMLKIYLREPKQDVLTKEEIRRLILSLQDDRDFLKKTAKSLLRRS
jgi:hypothetical protein